MTGLKPDFLALPWEQQQFLIETATKFQLTFERQKAMAGGKDALIPSASVQSANELLTACFCHFLDNFKPLRPEKPIDETPLAPLTPAELDRVVVRDRRGLGHQPRSRLE
jgi:hypothetical protein